MAQINVERRVAAPPDSVWRIITDLDGSPDVISGIDAVERLDDGTGFGVGTKWRETRTMFGRQATEDMEITSVEEGTSYVAEADNMGAHYVSTMWVKPADGGSIVGMSFEAQPTGVVGKVFTATVGKLFESGTRKAMAQDLDDIAAAAEGAG